jgi:transposase
VSRATDGKQSVLSNQELTQLLTALQSEVVGLKVEGESLRETIVGLTHENELLKRRLYGNKTERTRTSEMQLSLGDLLDAEKRLQKELDDAVRAAQDDAKPDVEPGSKSSSKKKGHGRRDLSASGLPRVVLDFTDEHLEKGAKRIGFDESFQLMFRPGGFAVLVRRVAKYEVPSKEGPTVLGLIAPKTLFPRGLLHSSAVAHLVVQKFALGVPFHRFEQHLESQACQIDRATMCRYAEEAGNTLGATIVQAMWDDALANAGVISTDATSAMIQPAKGDSNLRQACKKGHFFTAVVDCDYVLFAYTEKHTQEFVKKLFGGFIGYLQSDASNVYDILDRGPPTDTDEGVSLVGCFAHCRRYFFEAA